MFSYYAGPCQWYRWSCVPGPALPIPLAGPVPHPSISASAALPQEAPRSCTNFNIDNSNNNMVKMIGPECHAPIWGFCVDFPISSSRLAFDQLSGWILVVGRWVG